MTGPAGEPSSVLLDRIEAGLREASYAPVTAALADLAVLRDRLAAAEAKQAGIERELDAAAAQLRYEGYAALADRVGALGAASGDGEPS